MKTKNDFIVIDKSKLTKHQEEALDAIMNNYCIKSLEDALVIENDDDEPIKGLLVNEKEDN